MIYSDETLKKIESTINSICDHIQNKLEDNKTYMNDISTQEMIKALAELLKANA